LSLLLRKICNSTSDGCHFQQLIAGGPVLWSFLQQAVNYVPSLLAVHFWQGPWLTLHDFEEENDKIARLERQLQRQELVQHHTNRPDVCLQPICTVIANLWRRVIRCPDSCPSIGICRLEDFGNAVVSQLYHSSPSEENILALYIAVEYVPSVCVLQAEATLREGGHYLPFVEVTARFLLPLHCSSKVSTVCEFHDNQKPIRLKKGVDVSNYIDVGETPKHFRFVFGFLAGLNLHRGQVNVLDDQQWGIGTLCLVPHEHSDSI